MGESLQEIKTPDIKKVHALCTMLDEHKGGDIIALDLRELHSWTDFFVIVTVSSVAHLQGLLRHIKDFAELQGLGIFHRVQRKNEVNSGWSLVDMGTAVIHLMTVQSRDFYELEELWSCAGQIYPVKTVSDINYSSKSS
ncbi:MAG: ribosome silencing factor [Treponema sp.]|jgi:ribosome-associated protein|nr:ribosome silencing factor [Treponema sp.]